MSFHPAVEFYQKYGKAVEAAAGGGGRADFKAIKAGLAGQFVKSANAAYSVAGADFELLQGAIDARQERLAKSAGPETEMGTLVAELKARLVIGMSQGRLWGTGFQFHPVYGVPYLPASGIKGALRHFLEEQGRDEDQLKVWFGDTEHQGLVTIFDAFIAPTTKRRLLSEEILNKHHENYYEKEAGKIEPPADYNTPVPVKFVAVASGIKFRFVYGVRVGVEGREGPSLAVLRRDLVNCLDLAGMGAKTRKGYGRMVVPEVR